MRKTDTLAALLLVVTGTVATAATPDEIALLQRLHDLYPATPWTSVARTPIAGVYEAVMGANVAYVASDGRHFLFGHLFDMQSQTDLTAPKLGAAERRSDVPEPPRTVSFAALPLRDAIRQVNGKGTRRLAVFSDPNCPYCRMLDTELAQLADVTVYTFLLPWVSPDRSAAQAVWASAHPERADDAAVLDRNLRLATQIGLRGTPLLIAGDGRISEGAARATELDAWLNTTPATVPLATTTTTRETPP